MNYTPTQWLQIGLANAFGQDKLSFGDRLSWVTNQPACPDALICTDPAEEPAYALAMIDGLMGNRHVRVHLDATASGTQILAAFANCKKSGTHCNLFGETRQDAYTNAWRAMGMTGTIPRSDVKRAFMTLQNEGSLSQ